jgi:heme exporter protein A
MLQAINLSYSRSSKPLFHPLSFTLKEGKVLVIKGENGSGKTTLLRLLSGLIQPSSGMFFWKGEAFTSQKLHIYKQDLLYVGHKLGLYPAIRVQDQLALWQDLYGISTATFEEALQIWSIAEFKEKRIYELSQGQQKRLSLTRCSWLKRPLWILDEPLAGLDHTGKRILNSILLEHLTQGGSAVIATHEPLEMPSQIKSQERTL